MKALINCDMGEGMGNDALIMPYIQSANIACGYHDGVQSLQIIGAGFIFYGIGMVMIQALNGAGDTKTPTWINFFVFWLFQVPLAYLLVKVLKMGVAGAFIAIPVAETLLALIAWYYFKKGKWKSIAV